MRVNAGVVPGGHRQVIEQASRMSVDVHRHYIFPVERLRDAFEAAAEVHARSRNPLQTPLLLPDGSLIHVPFAYDDAVDANKPQPRRTLEPGDALSFGYLLRVFVDESLEEYLDPEDESYRVRHLKGGGRRAIFPLFLDVRVEPPYAEFVFSNPTTRLAFVLFAPSSVAVLDYIGRQAGALVTYENNPDGCFIESPLKTQFTRPDDDGRGLEAIVRFVEQQSR